MFRDVNTAKMELMPVEERKKHICSWCEKPYAKYYFSIEGYNQKHTYCSKCIMTAPIELMIKAITEERV